MWRRELLKNKIYSLILIGLGALSIPIEYDGTFFIFSLMLGISLFFSKQNWIYGSAYERQRPKKKRFGMSRPYSIYSDQKYRQGRRAISQIIT